MLNRTLQSSPEKLVAPSFKSVAIPQMTTASVSFLASTAMAIMIARTGLRLSKPYRRIIFGLSIGDMVQSLSFLAGPISVPFETPQSWGLGNDATCKTTGFLLSVGFFAVPMYTCFVCWYYLCKLKYRMSDEAIAHRSERKIHTLIILFVIILSLTELGLNTFHPKPMRTFCHLSPTPIGCRAYKKSKVQCDAAIGARVDIFRAIEFSLQLVCLLGMVVMMGMIYIYVIQRNSIFQPRIPNHNLNWPYSEDEDGGSGESLTEIQEEVLYLSAAFRDEILIQMTCYVGAFCLTYIPFNFIYLMAKADMLPSRVFIILSCALVPFGGFFNILVYSRPQVSNFQRSHPDQWWIVCLWLVLRSGLEIPDNDSEDNSEDGYSFSSNDPFGEEDHAAQEKASGLEFSSNELGNDSKSPSMCSRMCESDSNSAGVEFSSIE